MTKLVPGGTNGYKGSDATFLPREQLAQVGHIIDLAYFLLDNGGQAIPPTNSHEKNKEHNA